MTMVKMRAIICVLNIVFLTLIEAQPPNIIFILGDDIGNSFFINK